MRPQLERHGDRLIGVLSEIILLIVWALLDRVRLINAQFFPPPSRIAATFLNLARTGDL